MGRSDLTEVRTLTVADSMGVVPEVFATTN
ncbi:MAG: hypothetical protein RLY14_682, partial [Planctomycetota bacterium]